MTLTWSRTRTLVAGLALIALTNAIALGGVAWNRSGEPESVLTLTQRELGQSYRSIFDRESDGLELGVRWRVVATGPSESFYPDHYGAPEWLDREKLAALGFDVSRRPDARRRHQRLLPREALVVLELDGPARQKALERARAWSEQEAAKAAAGKGKTGPGSPAQNAADALKREETSNSRLFAVDTGLDAQALRAKYPDRSRYAIMRGKIRPQLSTARGSDGLWTGHIDSLDNTRVNVPLEFRKALGSTPRSIPMAGPTEGGPGFEVTVAFGKRFEPWIVAAAPVGK